MKLKVNPVRFLNIQVITLLLAVGAFGLSAYSVYLAQLPVSSARILSRNFAADPKAVVVKNLEINTRVDGTLKYFIDNRKELISNVEIMNFLENGGVGLAFVRTSIGNKRLQYCLWMRKYPTGWESVGWISPSGNNDPFRRGWIRENESWLREMDSKKVDWELGSECVWELKTKVTTTSWR